jgi:hypothetical protein
MRGAPKSSFAIKMPTGKWWLVFKGKRQDGEHPSADAAESAYSDKEGKR